MTQTEVRDYGEDGINLVAQYATPDEQIFGTIFIYRPSLADSGLTFLATDEAIRRRFSTNINVVEDSLVPVSGVAKAGRRVIYSISEGGLRHSALTIVRAGDWLLKYRVSGPASRGSEIAKNLDALVEGTKFDKGSKPLPTHVIQVQHCTNSMALGDAKEIKPKGESVVALALLAVPRFSDREGEAVDDPTGRVPDRLCLADSSIDEQIPVLTLHTVDSQSGMFAAKMFQLYGDAGIIVEVTRPSKASNELFALRHSMGQTLVYGGFVTEPSSRQLKLIRQRSDHLPIVATITDKPDGKGSDIELYCNGLAEGCAKK